MAHYHKSPGSNPAARNFKKFNKIFFDFRNNFLYNIYRKLRKERNKSYQKENRSKSNIERRTKVFF